MSKQWHKGPPPSVGWWPASAARYSDATRWWDGERWSHAAFEGEPLDAVVFAASQVSPSQQCIEWHRRPKSWPKRSHT